MAPKSNTKVVAAANNKAQAKPAKSGSDSETSSEKKPRMTQAVKLQNAIRAAIEKLNEEKFSKALDILQKAVEVKERKPNAYNEFVAKHMKDVLANLKKEDPNADRTQCMAIIGNMWKKQKATESKSDDEKPSKAVKPKGKKASSDANASDANASDAEEKPKPTKVTKTVAKGKGNKSDTDASDAEKPKEKVKGGKAKKPEPIPIPEPETESDDDDSDDDEEDDE